jgi:trehalose 6-phosphate phosphatase
MSRPPPHPALDLCLFLDIDGTLVEFTNTPSETRADPEIKVLIAALVARLRGAVALVSGREIRTIDALFAPLILPASGLHGGERRDAAGVMHVKEVADGALHEARVALEQLALAHPGVLIEDKGHNVAVHFRLAPQSEGVVRAAVAAIAAPLRERYQLQEGIMMWEFKPWGNSKGSAVQAFMGESPFRGRRPVFIGDDLTDMDGFAAVEAAGGISIGVGSRVIAQYNLDNVAAVRGYLQGFMQLNG